MTNGGMKLRSLRAEKRILEIYKKKKRYNPSPKTFPGFYQGKANDAKKSNERRLLRDQRVFSYKKLKGYYEEFKRQGMHVAA